MFGFEPRLHIDNDIIKVTPSLNIVTRLTYFFIAIYIRASGSVIVTVHCMPEKGFIIM